MTIRPFSRVLHIVAGIVAFLMISAFLVRTLLAEAFGSAPAIIAAKAAIVAYLPALVIALAATGATGFILAGRSPKGLAATKLRRMRIIAPNGLLVLIPAAIFLNWKAQAGAFDPVFFTVQAVEIVAGALNLFLLGLNIRDGLAMKGRFRARRAKASLEHRTEKWNRFSD